MSSTQPSPSQQPPAPSQSPPPPPQQYLIRFAQAHETFRQPELEALSRLSHTNFTTVSYSADSPFCVVQFNNPNNQNAADTEAQAKSFISASILSRAIYELWGVSSSGSYEALHADVRRRSSHLWERYRHVSFKFGVDTFLDTRSAAEQRAIIDGFAYLGFQGKIEMKRPQVEFCVFEEWEHCPRGDGVLSPSAADEAGERDGGDLEEVVSPRLDSNMQPARRLKRVYLGRKVGESRRQLIEKHDLKKRPYISTTSMDAELALVTANAALAGPGKLFLDPFVGTGGFMVAAAELGAVVLGSDIDGRSFRGKGAGTEKGVGANFKKYRLLGLFGDCITSDLTNTPFRSSRHTSENEADGRWLDGIICDPPYGVREGLKVLGTRHPESTLADASDLHSDPSRTSTPRLPYLIDGVPAHTLPGYIAPKRPYSFNQMLDDILEFAARTLVNGGRLAFWMPSANENEAREEEVMVIPMHRLLKLKHECVQRFNRWSRRLLVYERIAGCPEEGSTLAEGLLDSERVQLHGRRADDLNPFRRRYFQAFNGKSS